MYVKFLLFQLLLLAAMFFVFERFLMFYVFAGFFMFWIILVKLLATFGRTSKDIKGLCNQNKNNNTISGNTPSFGHSATQCHPQLLFSRLPDAMRSLWHPIDLGATGMFFFCGSQLAVSWPLGWHGFL